MVSISGDVYDFVRLLAAEAVQVIVSCSLQQLKFYHNHKNVYVLVTILVLRNKQTIVKLLYSNTTSRIINTLLIALKAFLVWVAVRSERMQMVLLVETDVQSAQIGGIIYEHMGTIIDP